jgi:hypothetical protein
MRNMDLRFYVSYCNHTFGYPIVIVFITINQEHTSRSKGFTSSRVPNLGKSCPFFACRTMSSANLQVSPNPKPRMVGTAEEPPRNRGRK